ncbi:MAG TPA: GAF domain-containing sensor histidine kinase [Thermoanaerobaculia bacterium]|jgi:PAS domain S-box-containing protein
MSTPPTEDCEPRQSARVLRFLVALNQAVQPLTNPDEIMSVTARLLGETLGVNRCAYAEVEEDQDHFVITGDYTRDTFSILGRFAMSAFGGDAHRLSLEGVPYVVDDAANDPRVTSLDAYRQTDIAAVISVPLRKAGRFVAGMAVHQKVPRHWTAEEIELVELVVSRCWEALERARAIRRLHESEERLRLAMEAGGVATWELDFVNSTVTADEKFAELFGISVDEIRLGAPLERLMDIIPADDRQLVHDTIAQAVAGSQDYMVEHRVMAGDGVRWVAVRGRIERDAAGNALRMRGAMVDISERMASFERERELRARAEEANQVRDEFLAAVSHELRTPLTAMLGWATLLRMTSTDPEALRGLMALEQSARAQARIIDDLLDMSRLHTGKLHYEMKVLEPRALVGSAVQSLRHVADEKSIALDIRSEGSDVQIRGDAGRLLQVLWNLLSNAIKFTPLQGRVTVTVAHSDSHLCITVRDSGIGISAEFLPHVFEPFRQGDSSFTRPYGGLGLGLTISRHIVEAHGGTIHAESEGEDRGTAFTVELPLESPR